MIGHRFAEFSPISTIGRVNAPILLLHGRQDTTVPISDAPRLHEHKAGGFRRTKHNGSLSCVHAPVGEVHRCGAEGDLQELHLHHGDLDHRTELDRARDFRDRSGLFVVARPIPSLIAVAA